MLKQTIAVTGLCLLALSTTPLAAQTPAATRCQAATQGSDTVRPAPGQSTGYRGHVKVFDGRSSDIAVAANGDAATPPADTQNATLSARKTGGDGAETQSNNLKQLGLATNTCN